MSTRLTPFAGLRSNRLLATAGNGKETAGEANLVVVVGIWVLAVACLLCSLVSTFSCSSKKGRLERRPFRLGVTGFEPATSCSQSRRAAKLRHTPLSGDCVRFGSQCQAARFCGREKRVLIERLNVHDECPMSKLTSTANGIQARLIARPLPRRHFRSMSNSASL
jgi:hypothetical protein